MRFRLRTLVIASAIGPPVLAGAWLWCKPLIADALILLLCELLATAMMMAVLAVVGLVWALSKRAIRLTRVLLRLPRQISS